MVHGRALPGRGTSGPTMGSEWIAEEAANAGRRVGCENSETSLAPDGRCWTTPNCCPPGWGVQSWPRGQRARDVVTYVFKSLGSHKVA